MRSVYSVVARVWFAALFVGLPCLAQVNENTPQTLPKTAFLLHLSVIDRSSRPLAGAEIRLDGEPTGLTDATGQYYLSRKPLTGEHTVRVGLAGYQTFSSTVTLPAGDQPGIDLAVQLQPEGETEANARENAIQRGSNEPNYHLVRIFYATDRQDTKSSDPTLRYANDRSSTGTLSMGTAEISIPRDHRPGALESPSWLHLEFRPDPEKHVVLESVQPLETDAFYKTLNAKVSRSSSREIVVFIHGYNNSFDSGARTLAQFTYDLRFDGAPVLYSWPSKDRVLGYTEDEDTVQWTAFHLRAFLEELTQRTHASAIHLIAHSMGNRALTSALQIIAAKHSNNAQPIYGQVVLAAPDIGAETLQLLANEIRPVAKRITLYASANDDALMLSSVVHGVLRAGGADGKFLLVAPGIDTVDASKVQTDFLGHTYFDKSATILTDIHKILATGEPPDLRNLVPAFFQNLKYWIIPVQTAAQSSPAPVAIFH